MTKSVPFNIIKFKGDANTVTLYDGTKIQRSKDDFIFVPEYKGFVRKAPYGMHFVFELPKKEAHRISARVARLPYL